jgi:hypothetical protein
MTKMVLERLFPRWDRPPNADCTLSRDVLDEPPEQVSAPSLIARKGLSIYGTFRVDHVQLFLGREDCFRLGLLIAACVVYQRVTRVQLKTDASDVKQIVIAPHSDFAERGLRQSVTAVMFWPKPLAKAPWYPLPDYLLRTDLPSARLASADDEQPITDTEWEARDTLYGFGNH